MGSVAEYDWKELQATYVQANPVIGLREMHKQTGVSFPALQRHCTGEGWVRKRLDYQDAVMSKAQGLAIQKHALARVETIDVVDTAIDLASAQLVSMSEALAGKSWENAEPQEIARASASVTTALEKIAKLKRLINGESTENSQVCLSTLLAQVRSE